MYVLFCHRKLLVFFAARGFKSRVDLHPLAILFDFGLCIFSRVAVHIERVHIFDPSENVRVE